MWRAEAPDGRAVAVKIYREDNAAAARERAMLEDVQRRDPEAGAWLIRLLGHGAHEGRAFLVLEWMPETLASWCASRPLPARLVALERAVEAVLRLHRSPTDLAGWHVHRDIKPANLLVAEVDGQVIVKIADLGTARQDAGALEGANTGHLTPRYAPPEQALPLDAPPQESWDIHALAVTVFQGLTGGFPSAARQAQALFNDDGLRLLDLADRAARGLLRSEAERAALAELRARPAESLLDIERGQAWRTEDQEALERALGADVDDPARAQAVAQLAEVLASCLAPHPRRREQTGRPLLRALRGLRVAILGELGTVATPSPTSTQAEGRRWIVVGLGLFGAIAVLLIAGISLALWRTWAALPAPEPAPPPPSAAPVATPEPAPAATPATEPAPTRRARANPAVTAAVEPVWVDVTLLACPLGDVAVRVDSGEAQRVPPDGLSLRLLEGEHALSWSLPGVPASPSRDRTVRVAPDGARFCQDFTDGLCPERDCR